MLGVHKCVNFAPAAQDQFPFHLLCEHVVLFSHKSLHYNWPITQALGNSAETSQGKKE